MQNKVLVFDENQNLTAKCIEKLEKFLLSRGLFNFSFLTSSDYEIFKKGIEDCRQEKSTVIVICDNDRLDECLGLVKDDSDSLTLINEQAVKLEDVTQDLKMIFIPFELPFENFLKEFVANEKVFVCSLFGCGRSVVEQKFKALGNEYALSYKIITKTLFLHTVYYSEYIDESRLKSEFGESLYSDKDETLPDKLSSILKERGKSLSVVEFGTRGKTLSRLDFDGKVFYSVEQMKEYGVPEELFAGENAGKDVAFTLAKFSLEKSKSEYVLSVCDRLGETPKSYVAVGDKSVVHLYSSVFSEDKYERMRDLSDFAIFRMICFLKNQNV